MKLIQMILAVVFLSASTAYAATANLNISNDYQTGASTVTYTLSMTSDTQFCLETLIVDIDWDATELTLESYTNLATNYGLVETSMGEGAILDTDQGEIVDFTIASNPDTNSYMDPVPGTNSASGETIQYLLGTFTFSIAPGAMLDGDTDFSLRSSFVSDFMITFFDGNGNRDCTIESYLESETYTVNGYTAQTNGLNYLSDIGPASVPVPGALALLGTGLLSLAGMGRKNR